nr:hypothetical protein [Tanacetum cinerariifolium]
SDDQDDDDDEQDDDDQDDNDQDEGNDDDDHDTNNEGDEFVHPKLSIHGEEETKDEESFDPIAKTPKNSNDEGKDDASLGLNVGSKEGHDAEDDEEDHAKSGEVRWWEIVRGRLQDATTDHMIYHMMSLSYKGQTHTYLSCEFVNI